MDSTNPTPTDDEKRTRIVKKMMEKFSLRGKKGRVFVGAVIDKVGLDERKVAIWIQRAKIAEQAQAAH